MRKSAVFRLRLPQSPSSRCPICATPRQSSILGNLCQTPSPTSQGSLHITQPGIRSYLRVFLSLYQAPPWKGNLSNPQHFSHNPEASEEITGKASHALNSYLRRPRLTSRPTSHLARFAAQGCQYRETESLHVAGAGRPLRSVRRIYPRKSQ